MSLPNPAGLIDAGISLQSIPPASSLPPILSLLETRVVDGIARIIPAGEDLYRFRWRIEYRLGRSIDQYSRIGSGILQYLFARIPHVGIRRIEMVDSLRPEAPHPVVDIPEDAEALVYYDCAFEPATGRTTRITVFGYRRPDGSKSLIQIDPMTEPPTVRQS